MATILDVAKLAGVSQGTVSNVLNGKGNVSSEKIRIVEEAARKLGYTINEQARILRKGSGKIIGVILPTVESKQYREFYNSLKYYAERNGYSTELYISNNNPQTEQEMIQKAKSVMVCGMAVITCLNYKDNVYQHSGLNNVRFVERRPGFQADYYGFDYKLAGNHIARKILTKKYRKHCAGNGIRKIFQRSRIFKRISGRNRQRVSWQSFESFNRYRSGFSQYSKSLCGR